MYCPYQLSALLHFRADHFSILGTEGRPVVSSGSFTRNQLLCHLFFLILFANLFLHILHHIFCDFWLATQGTCRRWSPQGPLSPSNRPLCQQFLPVPSEELNLLQSLAFILVVYQQHFSRPLRRASPCASVAFM